MDSATLLPFLSRSTCSAESLGIRAPLSSTHRSLPATTSKCTPGSSVEYHSRRTVHRGPAVVDALEIVLLFHQDATRCIEDQIGRLHDATVRDTQEVSVLLRCEELHEASPRDLDSLAVRAMKRDVVAWISRVLGGVLVQDDARLPESVLRVLLLRHEEPLVGGRRRCREQPSEQDRGAGRRSSSHRSESIRSPRRIRDALR